MLNPSRSGESIPVLTMPSSVRLWRKIRWPLLVTIVLVILLVVGLFTNNILVANSVERKLEDALEAETLSTVDGLRTNQEILQALAQRNPDRVNAQISFAWNTVLMAEMHGDAAALLETSTEAFGRFDPNATSMASAASAGKKYHQGDLDGAMQAVLEGLKKYPKEERLQLVRSWILASQGKADEALEVLKVLRTASPEYLPSLHACLIIALDARKRTLVKEYSNQLLTLSPGSLLGSLGSVAARLPQWNGAELSAEEIVALVGDMKTLSRVLKAAPPRLAMIGRYMSGRVSLLALDYKSAAADLKYVAGRNGVVDAVAWYGMAVRALEGPKKALEVLKGANGEASSEINSLRARCLLDGHRVAEAAEAIAGIGEDQENMGKGELEWILAVRSADIDEAKTMLPDTIGRNLMWVGVEMYHLLRRHGDAEGMELLASRMKGGAEECAVPMRTWLGASLSEMKKTFVSEESAGACNQALTANLMHAHLAPDDILAASERAVAVAEGELLLEVDRALALWLAKGKADAEAVLDSVVEQGADGPLLGIALSRAYLRMGSPQKALDAVADVKVPEAVSLSIQSLFTLGKKKKAEKRLAAALADETLAQHPAIAYLGLSKRLESSAFEEVVERADELLPTAGMWTAEIAELKAKAQNAMGSRGDADRGLAHVAKKVKKAVGFDEAWQTKLALIRLNLRRGGNFLFKAVGVTLEMYKGGVKDAELSYSYAVANIRQGNERGAIRYLKEAVELDPSFLPTYEQLNLLGKLSEEYATALERTSPGTRIE